MNWIKGNGFVKGLFVVLMMILTAMPVLSVNPVYNDGKWYSLYDHSQEYHIYSANTWTTYYKNFSVYPPCGSPFTLNLCRQAATKGECSIYTNSNETLLSLSDVTTLPKSHTTNPNETLTVNKGLFTTVTFSKYGWSSIYFKNLEIPLATHVRLNDNSTYGVTEMSYQFGKTAKDEVKYYTINIRSFLTSSNLKMRVVSDDGDTTASSEAAANTIFKIIYNGQQATSNDVYITTERNICGYQDAGNATASTTPATPINTSLISVVIQYSPDVEEFRIARLEFVDGDTVRATVRLSGNGTNYLSNGKPYYAQKITSNSNNTYARGEHKWFALYADYAWTNNKTNQAFIGYQSLPAFDVFGPCVKKMSMRFRMDGTNPNDDGRFIMYTNNKSDSLRSWPIKGMATNGSGVKSDTNWTWKENFNLDSSSIWKVSFGYSGNLGAYIDKLQIELDKHVYFQNGTNDLTEDFGKVKIGTTKIDTIYLRSFLTTTNLKMKLEGDNASDFELVYGSVSADNDGYYYITNTANVCGFPGGEEKTSSNETISINTDSIPIIIKFKYSNDSSCNATLKFYDGSNEKAAVRLTANGKDNVTDYTTPTPIFARKKDANGEGDGKWFALYARYATERQIGNSMTFGINGAFGVYSPCNTTTASCMVRLSANNPNEKYYRMKYNGNSTGNDVFCQLNKLNYNPISDTWVKPSLSISQIYKIQIWLDEGNLHLYTNNFQIELADHILLYKENNTCGSDTLTINKTVDPTALGSPILVTIPFRSFHTSASSIKIKMASDYTNNNPNIFRVNGSSTECTTTNSYTILDNSGRKDLCGIKGGEGGSDFTGSDTKSVPGNASLLDVPVYVYPTGTGTYSAKYEISDGTNTACATINVTVAQSRSDLCPSCDKSYTPDTSAPATNSTGKPYYNSSDNTWYSLYHSDSKITSPKRTIINLAVYPPCTGDLSMIFYKNASYDWPTSFNNNKRDSAYLFVVGFNRLLKYKSADFTTDTKTDTYEDNDGAKNFAWNMTNSYSQGSAQTISCSKANYICRDTIYNVQIYNAIGRDIDVNNIKLKLANHVRIDDGTMFGTTHTSKNFNDDSPIIYTGDTLEYSFNLRSFLAAKTSGKLIMKIVADTIDTTNTPNDLRNAFVIEYDNKTSSSTNISIPIAGANICGFPGAEKVSTSSDAAATPINTLTNAIKIKYHPTAAGTHKATLVFYDNDTIRATVSLEGSATALIFDNNEGDNKWFTVGNWVTESGTRLKRVPKATDDVQINANCVITGDTANAKCNNMTFREGTDTLVVDSMSTLVASGSITTQSAGNLYLRANNTKSASVLFSCTDCAPKATVECWFRGKSSVKSATETNIRIPQWQYRGFIGNPDPTYWETTEVVVYKWDEKQYGWIEEPVYQGEAWTGYSMANLDTNQVKRTYTTTLIPTNQPHQISLSKTGTTTNSVRSGLNLFTNSFSAPVLIDDIVFSDNVDQAIIFFRTRSNQEVKEINDDETTDSAKLASLYVTCPKNTAKVAGIDSIPAGASFFCFVRSGTSESLTLPEPTASASGKIYAPRKEKFNVLKIFAESDSESDVVYLVESDNCSHNYDDGYDGTKYFTDGMGQIYGKNDFGRTFIAADSSMLGQLVGFKAGSNDMTYRLRFDTERLTGYDELYLYDRVTKRYVNILEGGTYEFNGTTEGEDDRFQILGRMEGSDEFVTGSEHVLEVVSDRAFLRGFDGQDEVIYMTDLAGKVVWSDNAKRGPWFELPTNLAAGLYIIHCGDVGAKYLVTIKK